MFQQEPNYHFWRNFWPVLRSLRSVQGVVNTKFGLRRISLTVQWPATQSPSKIVHRILDYNLHIMTFIGV